jgi:DNA-binding transcriptional LysR family regulator
MLRAWNSGMDLRQIQYFVSLFEEKSITKAARRLIVVQPAVSMQIKRLEEEYGLQLFDRTSHGVFPTAIAKRLYPICLSVLEGVDEGRKMLRDSVRAPSGDVAIAIPPSMANALLVEQMLLFKQRHPNVQVKVREGYSADIVEWLTEGHVDFAVVSMREDNARLRYQTLINEELVVVVNPGSDFDGRTVITGTDLSQFKVVLPSGQNLTRILIDAAFERSGVALTPSMEIDSLAFVFDLLSRPGWATILPASAYQYDRRAQQLTCLQLIQPTIRRSLTIASDTQRQLSQAAALLINQLESALMALESGRPRDIISSHHATQ